LKSSVKAKDVGDGASIQCIEVWSDCKFRNTTTENELSVVVPSGFVFIIDLRTDPESVLLGLLSESFLDKKMVDGKGGNLKNHPPLQKLKGEAFPVLPNGVNNPASATPPFQIYRFNV
jgi:hypothetical protein